jgi:hypothetical protein
MSTEKWWNDDYHVKREEAGEKPTHTSMHDKN